MRTRDGVGDDVTPLPSDWATRSPHEDDAIMGCGGRLGPVCGGDAVEDGVDGDGASQAENNTVDDRTSRSAARMATA